MILVIDNYDSFTYNLVQYVGEMGYKITVVRNDAEQIKELQEMNPDKMIISPGPGYPAEAGLTLEIIKAFAGKIPILGVCLGMQSIGQVFGAAIVPAAELVHGKNASIEHDSKTIFHNIPNPFQGGRYHSLVVAADSMPSCLQISAQSRDGEVMAIRHNHFPVEGVQFHPESILTEPGYQILKNFMSI
ncbi:anthranilate/aminodeoxychorismate synthase component II [candidate division KSB1 bacterium]|nr:anthranilate/aminodeoxychorismate synthase component II [candidate division KSB1 bacterium]